MNFRPLDLFRLDKRVAIVTGGTKGIGKAIAGGLAGAGANVLIVSRHGDEAAATALEISAGTERECAGFEADVAKPELADSVVGAALERFGRLDILVNNAGIGKRGAIEELDANVMRAIWETNVLGPWSLCRAAARTLKQQRWGRVINIGSLATVVGVLERTPYASSKAAIAGLTRALALEWAMYGITVNAISPGPIASEMTQALTSDPLASTWWTSRIPLGRWGKADEIAGAAVFLASEASSFVTGSILMVDGGWTAQ